MLYVILLTLQSVVSASVQVIHQHHVVHHSVDIAKRGVFINIMLYIILLTLFSFEYTLASISLDGLIILPLFYLLEDREGKFGERI